MTLDKLVIDPGYWRANESSTDILQCYNTNACLGGVTGSVGYCLEGYQGPCECLHYDGQSRAMGMLLSWGESGAASCMVLSGNYALASPQACMLPTSLSTRSDAWQVGEPNNNQAPGVTRCL